MWRKYQARTAGGKPRPLLIKAISYVKEKGAALDIGAGALNDVDFLLSFADGFHEIVAVDKLPQFKKILVPNNIQFTYIETEIEKFDFPENHFNLISAQFVLPFIQKEEFDKVWERVNDALKPGGVFVGQLFGDRDDWAGRSGMTFHTKNDVDRLISKFEVISCDEIEYIEESNRKKHWHYFDLILKKPAR